MHSTAQKNLLNTFGELIDKSTLIYTTHSHHLINPEWLNGAYIIRNKAFDYTDELNTHSRFYELGYRFIESEWGKGFATESSRAILQHAFTTMKLENIYAITDAENTSSRNVLEKCGFKCVTTFDLEGDPTFWFELSKNTWFTLKV